MGPRNTLLILTLAAALGGCSEKTPGAGQPATNGVGERIYSGSCVPCHQQNGVGIPGVYPSLAGSPVVLGDTAQLTRWVLKGERPASMPAGRYPTQMLQFGWLKPADAAALFSYLRSNFGNAAPAVDADSVARALGQ